MNKGCIFVGGVHGSGKTFLCERIQKELGCTYISASLLLQWKKVEKEVDNVVQNQIRLKQLLLDCMNDNQLYLIDGHFALWNKERKIEMVSLKFFEGIGIKCVVLVWNDIEVILKNLKQRSGLRYSSKIIAELFEVEKNNSIYVADYLKVPFFLINPFRENDIKQFLIKVRDL